MINTQKCSLSLSESRPHSQHACRSSDREEIPHHSRVRRIAGPTETSHLHVGTHGDHSRGTRRHKGTTPILLLDQRIEVGAHGNAPYEC